MVFALKVVLNLANQSLQFYDFGSEQLVLIDEVDEVGFELLLFFLHLPLRNRGDYWRF